MALRIQRISSSEKGRKERRILVAMILSKDFLRRASRLLERVAFSNEGGKLLHELSLGFWRKHQEAIGFDALLDLCEAHQKRISKEVGEEAEALLRSLLEEPAPHVSHVLDLTATWVRELALEELRSGVALALSAGDLDLAEGAVAKWKLPPTDESKGISPLTDAEALFQALEGEDRKPLLGFPGAMAALDAQFAEQLFVAFMAPEKRGKSFWLIELLVRAILSGKNVAYFEAGDSPQSLVIRRMASRFTEGFMYPEEGMRPPEISMPLLDCYFHQIGGTCPMGKACSGLPGMPEEVEANLPLFLSGTVKHYSPCPKVRECRKRRGSVWYERIRPAPLDWRKAHRVMRAVSQSRKAQVRLSCHATDSLSVKGIHSILDSWEAEDGFAPQVVLVDYADILAPEDSREEFRHRQNATWKALRRLSLSRRCLVATATQASGESYEARTLRRTHYSEDKRKYAHATLMLGLNQTEEEAEAGLLRVNVLVQREGQFKTSKTFTVLERREIGRVCIDCW